MKTFYLTICLSFIFSHTVFAKTIKATDLNNSLINEIFSSSEDVYTIEFQKGDLIPLNFEAKGDLVESKRNVNNTLNIKRDFFVRVKDQKVLLSFDGIHYQPARKLIKGSLSVSSSEDTQEQIPSFISILLGLYLR